MSMTKPRQRGFTLIELIIFIVVVGAGLAGILSVMNTVVKSSADPLVRKQTIAIAESLLEEILLRDYAKPTDSTAVSYGNVDWNRSAFDWVFDYKGYTSTGIVNSENETVAGLDGYNIAPAVDVVLINDPLDLLYRLYRVTVSVTGPGGTTISLTGYRGNDIVPDL